MLANQNIHVSFQCIVVICIWHFVVVFLCCFADFDECMSSPCANNGTCHDALNSYTCSCHRAWTGVNCTEGKPINWLPLEDVAVISKTLFLNAIYRLVTWALTVQLLADKCHMTSRMSSQHWLRCRQATSHYLNQCWSRRTSPCGVNSPQWVNPFRN